MLLWVMLLDATHAAQRSNNKDWLTRKQNNVSEWSDMSIHGLLFQIVSTTTMLQGVLV